MALDIIKIAISACADAAAQLRTGTVTSLMNHLPVGFSPTWLPHES